MKRTFYSAAMLCLAVLLPSAVAAERRPPTAQTGSSGASTAPGIEHQRQMDAFIAARQQLIEEEMAAREKLRGATPEVREKAMDALREKNRARREALHERGRALAESQPRHPRPFIEEIQLPPGAAPELEAFLVQRAELQNDRIELENSLLDATPEARETARRAFDEQALAKHTAMAELGVKVAAQSAARPLPPVPEPHIPANASPELKAFLQERHAQMKARRAFEERLRTLPPQAQSQAREAWERQQQPKRAALAEKGRKLAEAQEGNGG